MDNLLGEFMGTMVLMVFGCGVNANMTLAKTCGRMVFCSSNGCLHFRCSWCSTG